MLRDEQYSLYDEFAKRHGWSMKTLLVVNALFYAKDGMTQRDICLRTFQSKQAVSQIVKKLSAEGYVAAREGRGDKREKIVELTVAGRAHFECPIRHITISEDKAMAEFTPEEQELLVSLPLRFTSMLKDLFDENHEGKE